MSYVMGKKLEERGGFHLEQEFIHEGEGLWTRLKDVFESTYAVLHELAEEQGVGVEDIYAAEKINREFLGNDFEIWVTGDEEDQETEDSDIIRITLIYEDLAERYLQRILGINPEEKLREREKSEAFEVISWYIHFMRVKMQRALYVYQRQVLSDGAENYNGSVKVVLLAIDRSVEAWQKIYASEKKWRREIRQVLVVLEQLKRDIEKQFPKARAFKRPGFEKK
jgi:hypothetical protein